MATKREWEGVGGKLSFTPTIRRMDKVLAMVKGGWVGGVNKQF